jgi:hypothetical protein
MRVFAFERGTAPAPQEAAPQASPKEGTSGVVSTGSTMDGVSMDGVLMDGVSMEVHAGPLNGNATPPRGDLDAGAPHEEPIDLSHAHLAQASQAHRSDAHVAVVVPPAHPAADRSPEGDAASMQALARAHEPAHELSIPPVDLDVRFFEAPPPPLSPDASLEIEVRDPRATLKATAFAARRRAHLARYVTLAVGLSSALCLVALVKGAMARGDEASPSSMAAQTAQGVAVAPVSRPAATAPVALVNTPATTAPAMSPPVEANSVHVGTDEKAVAAPPENPAVVPPPSVPPTAAPVVPQASAPPTAIPAAPLAAAPPPALLQTPPVATPAQAAQAAFAPAAERAKPTPGAASREKVAAQAALERGRLADAVAAAARSVALDPTDAESWLILGAAHQARGEQKDANQSFKSCLELAKRGPKAECSALVR